MIKRTLGIAFLAACGLGSAAHAADLTVYEEAVVAPAPAPAFNWTGFYAGVHAGYGWAEVDNQYGFGDNFSELVNGGGNKPDGFFGGLQLGYNHQFANNVVLGVEADAAFADLKDSGQGISGDLDGDFYRFNTETKIDALGTVRARLGYAAGRFLPYVTGGFAWAHTDYNFSFDTASPTLNGSFSQSDVFTGWTVGAGLEYAITDKISAKLEYLYADLGSKDYSIDLGTNAPAGQFRGDLTLQTAKIGLNYKF
jgi:outer membrane immunogenic protein